ncbi:MAG: TIM barrel protein [Solobacterium sp.]|nr:TIM barrel protein [Solobacterium sp.]
MKTYVQQIMLGSVISTAQDADKVLTRIRNAGYDGIELNRFMIHPTSFMVRIMTRAAGMPTGKGGNLNWKGLLEQHDLSVASLHTDLGSLEKETAAVIQEAKDLHTDRVVITGMYRFDYGNLQTVQELAARLNKAGAVLRDSGISLLYHNHNVELLRPVPEKTAYDILIDETDPSCVNFEFDSYWFTEGGADALLWMKRLGNRMKMWHITDRGSRNNGPAITPILKSDSVELGTGNMNLDGLRVQAEANGVDAVVLETHRNWIGKDPVRSLEISASWLKERYGNESSQS